MIALSAARFFYAAIGAVMITTIGIAGLGVKRVSAQADAPDYAALMAAPDRSDGDRQADKRRDPVPFLAFAGLRPGMKVLDMGAGAGYSTELDARVVGPTGTVYGQNPPDLNERGRAAFAARLATPAMKNSVAALKPGSTLVIADHAVRVPVERDHRFRWKMITQSGGT